VTEETKMLTWIRRLLGPPVFEGNDEKTRVASLFNILLLASLATSLVTGIVAPLSFAQPFFAVRVAGLVFLLCLVSLILMRFGPVRVASVLLLAGLWCIFSVLTLLSGGVNSPFVMTYVMLTTMAGLLLGGWAAIVVAELSILASLALLYAKTIEVLPQPVLLMGPGPSWITLTANLIATVAMLFLATRAMNEALRRSRQAAAELDVQRETLEEIVAKRTQDLEYRAIQLATAADVGRAAASILELESLSHQVVDLVCDRFGLYYAGLFLLDDMGSHAVLEAGSGEAGRIMKEQGHNLEVGGLSMVGAACARREARIALDVGEESVRFDNPLLPETRSEVALPLVVGGQVLGALDVQSTEPAAFAKEDVAVLQLVADQVAVAVDNALKFSEEGKVLEATSPLFRASRRLASAATTDEIVQAIIDSISETEADGCAVARLSISPNGEVESARFLGSWDRSGAFQFPDGVTFLSSAWPVALERFAGFWTSEDITQADVESDDMRQFLARFGGRGFVNIPLRAAGRILGFVSILRYQAGPFSPVSVRLYETLVDQAAVGLERARLLEQAERRAAREQTLGRVSARMRETLDTDTVLSTAVEEIAGALGLAALDLRLGTDIDLGSSSLSSEQEP
jgi:GAF domain-containing protein